MKQASKTRQDIVSAFNRLVVGERSVRPPIAHVLKEARVARSTFYRHFDDRDTLLVEAMRAPLVVIADEIMMHGDGNRLIGFLNHFWDQRRGGRELLNGRFAQRLVRALADLVAERAPELSRSDAIRIADTQIALIRLWLSGETPDTAPKLAGRMTATARAQRAAFQP